ncbi:MAG: VUT family protein [Candidatus Dormibacter sp.]
MPVPTPRRIAGILALLGYIGVIVAANWAVQRYGLVNVGFGLKAPAAVYFVGIAFSLRDLVQNILGRWVSIGAIVVGAGVSAAVSPALALASGLAFFSSELADFVVYTPLLRRGWLLALIPANLVGCVVDSLVFLSIAFGSLSLLSGQVLGKAWMTLLAVILLGPVRRWYVVTPGANSGLSAGAAA